MVRFGSTRRDKFDPGEQEAYRAKMKQLLDMYIADELKAQQEYKELAMLMTDLGHHELVFDIDLIRADEKTHYDTLVEIRRLLFGG
jgi:rubrerythrin